MDKWQDCIHLDIDDDCGFFYDLDEDEVHVLCITDEGTCTYDFDKCPYYAPAWED